MTQHETEQAIAAELDRCDVVLALFPRGPERRKALSQRRKCLAMIKEWNVRDGIDDMTTTELLADLGLAGQPER